MKLHQDKKIPGDKKNYFNLKVTIFVVHNGKKKIKHLGMVLNGLASSWVVFTRLPICIFPNEDPSVHYVKFLSCKTWFSIYKTSCVMTS